MIVCYLFNIRVSAREREILECLSTQTFIKLIELLIVSCIIICTMECYNSLSLSLSRVSLLLPLLSLSLSPPSFLLFSFFLYSFPSLPSLFFYITFPPFLLISWFELILIFPQYPFLNTKRDYRVHIIYSFNGCLQTPSLVLQTPQDKKIS